jgi:hypothetical protein
LSYVWPTPSHDNDWLLCLVHQKMQRWRVIYKKGERIMIGRHFPMIFLPNQWIELHKRSSSGVTGADDPLQWNGT